ncbi:uncharacterized protein JCM15063_004169 [Sporobolomyces koalae]|uniref:uncharacterized protein n=1 Tax=Sporobolomyces koalae TaxID=500713 RepID=UPI00316C2E6C
MSSHAPSRLLQLPPEVLLRALAWSSPQDCARFSRVSKAAQSVCSTWTLYRDLLEVLCDPPPTRSSDHPYQLLCRRHVQATTACEALLTGTTPLDPLTVLETLVHLAETRPEAGIESLNEAFLLRYFETSSPNIHRLVQKPHHLRSQKEADVRVAELLAHLQCLSTPGHNLEPAARTAAREIAYERLNFTNTATYGPLRSDGSGRVDYRKASAIQTVMSANLDEARTMGWGVEGETQDTVVPGGWSSTRTGSAVSRSNASPADPRDWAGVSTHEWRGTYAFLHFPVWHHFNMHRSSTYVPSLAEENEALGDCMSLQLELLPEGAEVSPPMEAFDPRRLSRPTLWGRGRMPGNEDVSDDSEDEDFLGEDEPSEDSSGSPADSSDDGMATLFVTSRSRQPRDPSPNTSPAAGEDTDKEEFSPPIGPLPPASESVPGTARTSLPPKLAFQGSSMPLELRTLSFSGTFLNSQNHFNMRDRSIRGTVEMNAQGEIIWKYVIRYAGRDQWAMTGVQIGGPKSEYGVVGTWTCADRDEEEGPNGPFWYWPHMSAD